jgi:hypothetical protein
MLAVERKIITSKKSLNNSLDEKRFLKGSKNFWLNENMTAPFKSVIFTKEDAAKKGAVSPRQPCCHIP